MTKSIPIIALALLTGGLSGCSSYVKAVSAYAKVSGESVNTLSSAPHLTAQLCYQDAQSKFLQDHLPPGGGNSVSQTLWKEWLEKEKPSENQPTWKAYCKEIDEAGKGFSKAVDVLSTYAKALSDLAGEEEYDGKDIKNLLEGIGTIANTPSETKAGKAISGIAEPVSKIASLGIENYKRKKIKNYVQQANQHIPSILAGLQKYVEASNELLNEIELHQNQALNRFEAASPGLYKDPVDPIKVAQFYTIAVAMDKDLRANRKVLESFTEVLKSLKKAHEKLATVEDDDGGAKEIMRTVGELVSNLAKIKSALKNKED